MDLRKPSNFLNKTTYPEVEGNFHVKEIWVDFTAKTPVSPNSRHLGTFTITGGCFS